MVKNKLMLLAAVLFVGVLGGCGNSPDEDKGSTDATGTTETKLKVVSTNSIIGDMVEKVGGDLIDAHSIVPVGTDPHEYEPLPEDIRKASEADVVFYNGLNLETGNGWFDKLMETAGKEENEDLLCRQQRCRTNLSDRKQLAARSSCLAGYFERHPLHHRNHSRHERKRS